jgi:hypothetical protein
MFRKPILSLLCLPLLGGCFLTEDTAKPPAVTGPKVYGRLALQDFQGPQSLAAIVAIFSKDPVAVGFKSATRQLENAVTRGDGAPECRLGKGAKNRKDGDSGLISLGKLQFGAYGQSSQLAFTETENHTYLRRLPSDFATGLYEVVAEGTRDIPSFKGAVFSMPDHLRDVRANGNLFGASVLRIKKSDPLKFEWRASPRNDFNVVIADIVVETETEVYQLQCAALENYFNSEGNFNSWVLPAEGVAKLPTSASGVMHLVRKHRLGVDKPSLKLELHGVRTFYTKATLED